MDGEFYYVIWYGRWVLLCHLIWTVSFTMSFDMDGEFYYVIWYGRWVLLCHLIWTVSFTMSFDMDGEFYYVIVSPVRSTYGGYYGLVVVTPPPPRPRPPPRPQTLHRSHDNLKNLIGLLHILYVDWYRWEDAWEARWAQSDYLWATQAPRIAQNAHFFTLGPIYEKLVIIFFPCYKFVCSVMRS